MYDFVFSDNTIQVFVRVRPPDKDEVSQNSILQVDPNGSTLVLESKPTPRTFSFDHVADIDATQVNIKIHCKMSLRANPPPELVLYIGQQNHYRLSETHNRLIIDCIIRFLHF